MQTLASWNRNYNTVKSVKKMRDTKTNCEKERKGKMDRKRRKRNRKMKRKAEKNVEKIRDNEKA